MKFSAINAVALSLLAATATATPVPLAAAQDGEVNLPIPEGVEVFLTGEKQASGESVQGLEPIADTEVAARSLEKRFGPVVTVLGIAAIKGVAILTKIAIEIGADTVKSIPDFNRGREVFVRKTIDEMWNRNPDRNRYQAVACYNKGYHLANGKWTGRVKAKFELDLLHTDFDCLYMEGGNSFYTHAEGGWMNLGYKYSNRCSHDQKTGDLTCR